MAVSLIIIPMEGTEPSWTVRCCCERNLRPPPPGSKRRRRSSSYNGGNRKRLRCMKVQVKAKDVSAAVPVHRTTVRVDRRVIRADKDSVNRQPTSIIHNNNPNHSNGYLNLRQRPISPQPPPPAPPQRTLRNSEICSTAMRGNGNGNGNGGVRVIASPEKRPTGIQENQQQRHKSAGTSDSKKGGSSSGSGEAVAPPQSVVPVWPPKFVIALTNKEKEEDFMAIKGSKLPQRPKKRAKIIQRTINLVSPGTWLCDLTLERYEVREKEKKTSKKETKRAKGNSEHGVGFGVREGGQWSGCYKYPKTGIEWFCNMICGE